MRLLDGTATDLPLWMRAAFAALALVFTALAWWLASLIADAGWWAGAGAGLCVALALLLGISAIRGRIWRWMWLFPTSAPPGPGI